jgi:ribokinase
MFDVIVCGSLHLDIIVKTPALPRIDETAVGHGWAQVCGGKGGNQAMQARRAGAGLAMIGRVGADGFGQTLTDNLRNEGVDTSCLSIDPVLGSGMSVAILQDNGDYGAVIVSGSNTCLASADVAAHWHALGGARVLVLQNEIPHAANVAVARAAKASGACVVLNAAPARLLGDDLLDLVDVLVVNRVEAEAMTAQTVDDRTTARSAALLLLSRTPAAIVTLGGGGLVVAERGGALTEIDALPVEVTSSHGAGDCFVGTLAAQLAAGAPLLAACAAANQRAAEFVSRP